MIGAFVAQLVEHLFAKHMDVGSNPAKSTAVAGNHDCHSLQPASIQLALVLLEQNPVYSAVQTELLFVYLSTDDKVLKKQCYQCLQQHAAPALAQALQDNQILIRNLHQINDNFRGILYHRLERDGELKTAAQLATWLYQHNNKGLSYLLQALDQQAIATLLDTDWTDQRRHLDLSQRDLRQFPSAALYAFDPVYSLDLRHNSWLNPLSVHTLTAFPDLKTLYLAGSAWQTAQTDGIEKVQQAFPQLHILL